MANNSTPFPSAFPNVNVQGGTYSPTANVTAAGGPYQGGGSLQAMSAGVDPGTLGQAFAGQQAVSDAGNNYGTLLDQLNQLLTQQQNTNQTNQLNQQYGFDVRNLDLTNQGYGIQAGALARQEALAPQLQALAQQQFDLQEAGARQSADTQTRGSNSAATASGAYTSIGHNQQLGDIQTQLQQALSQIGLGRQQSSLSYQDQLASLRDSESQLKLMQDRSGLSREELSSRLQNALDSIGNPTDITGLLNQVLSAQQGDFGNVTTDLGQIEGLAGLGLLSPTTDPDNQMKQGKAF